MKMSAGHRQSICINYFDKDDKLIHCAASSSICNFTRTFTQRYSTGLYLSNFIREGVEVLAIEVDDRANA